MEIVEGGGGLAENAGKWRGKMSAQNTQTNPSTAAAIARGRVEGKMEMTHDTAAVA